MFSFYVFHCCYICAIVAAVLARAVTVDVVIFFCLIVARFVRLLLLLLHVLSMLMLSFSFVLKCVWL